MADADFSVYATVKVNTAQFEQGMNKATNALKSTNKVVDGLNSKLKTLFKSVGTVFAVSQLKKFSSESVKLWKYQNKQLNILNTTLKTTGADAWTSSKEISAMASSLQDVTNYGDEAILSMQNVLLGFRNIKGDNFKKATKSILDMSTVLGVDLTSASRTVGKALNDPINGISILTRYGIRLNDEQKTLIQTLMKTGKTAEAQDVILQELNKTYGGTAEATAEAGQQLKNVWGDVKEQIGVAFAGISDRFAIFMKDFLKNLNFEKFYNVMGNAYEMILTKINQIISKFKELKQNIKDFANSEDFKPFLRLFDTIAGTVKKEIGNINNFIEGFAEAIKNLVANIDVKKVEKIINVIITIINVVYDIRDEIASVMTETQNLLFTIFGNIWTLIKEVFENTNNEFANSEGNIHSWGDFIYEELNDVYKVFQDLMAHIKAILTGDWKLAWEYAKLATLRIIDSILEGIDTMLKAFPKMTKIYTDSINWMIKGVNKVREWLGEDPFDLLEPYKGNPDPFGVKDLIQKTEDEIAGITGDSPDHDILDLKGLSERSEGTIQNIIAQFTKANDILLSQRKERKDYFIDADNDERDSADGLISNISDWNNKLLSQILEGLNEYDENYLNVKKQIINAEKEEAIAKAETEAEKQKIALYYLGEIEKAEEDYHKAVAEKYASDLEIIENNKKRILEENKEIRDKTLSIFKDMGSKIGSVFSHVGKVVAAMMKGVLSVITKISSTFVKGIKTAFNDVKEGISQSLNFIIKGVKSAWSSFKDLVELNLDDTLISVLKFEDSILTFFYETLPQLPSFLNSVFESVVTTIGMIISSINVDNLTANIEQIILSLTSNLPAVVEDVLNLVSNLFANLITIISQNAPNIFNMVDSIFENIGNFVTEIIPDIINKLGQLLPTLITWLSKKFVEISDFIGNFFENLANNVNLGGIIDNVINSLENGVKQITESISNNFPKVMGVVTDFIQTITTRIPSLINNVLPNVLSALDVILNTVENFIFEIAPNIIDIMAQTLPTIITWLSSRMGSFITFIGKLFEEISAKLDIEEIINNLMDSLINGMEVIGNALDETLPKIFTFLENLIDAISEKLPKLIEVALPVIIKTITGMIDFIAGVLPNLISNLLPVIAEVLNNGLPELITSIVNFVVEIAKQLPQIIIDIFPTLMKGVTSLITELVTNLPSLLTSIIDALPELIQTIIYAVLENLPAILTAILEALPNILTSVVSGAFNLLHDLVLETDWSKIWVEMVNSLKSVGEGIVTFFSTIFDELQDKVFEPFGKWFKIMWTNLKLWFKKLWDGFLDIMKVPINAIIKAVNFVIDGLNKVNFSIPNWVPVIGGKSFGISIPNLQELAVGTQNARKGLTLVGEAGPELVNFRGGEQVLNNRNTNKALENMGGTTINQNVTFNNLQDTTAFAMIQQLKQYNRQMAINGII